MDSVDEIRHLLTLRQKNTTKVRTELPALLRQAREARHLTQAEMARRMGIKQHYLSMLETGEREITESIHARILLALEGD